MSRSKTSAPDLEELRLPDVARRGPEVEAPAPFHPNRPPSVRHVALLQRKAGNAAVSAMLRPPQREPAPAPALQESGRMGGGTIDESVMIGAGGGVGAGAGKVAAGGAAAGAGKPVGPAAAGQRAAILADATASTSKLQAEHQMADAQIGAGVAAAKAVAVSSVAGATATAQGFFAARRGEIVTVTNTAEQLALTGAATTTAAAQGVASAASAQLQGVAAAVAGGLQARVGGFAGQIAGVIGNLSLPDLPGVSALKNGAANLVRRAAGGVTAGIGVVQQLVSRALRAGTDAVRSLIGKAGSVISAVVQKIGAAVRSAAAAATRVLTTIAAKVGDVLQRVLRVIVFPAIDKLRSVAGRHIAAGFKKAAAAVRLNTDHHLAILDKVARLAPSGPARHGGPAGSGAGEDATASFESIGKSAKENNKLVVDLFGGRLASVVRSVKEMATRAVDSVVGHVRGVVSDVVATVTAKVQEALQPVRAIASAVTGFFGSVLAQVRSGLATAVDWLRSAVTNPVEQLVAFGGDVLGRARGFIGNLVRKVLSGDFSLPNLGGAAFRSNTEMGSPVAAEAAKDSITASSGSVLGILGTVAAVIGGILLLPAAIAAAGVLLLVAAAALVLFSPLLLLAALLYGAYRFVKWVFTPSKLEVKHTTVATAAGNKDPSRRTVGVGEIVRLTSNNKGKWTSTDGTPKSGPTGDGFRWTAPERAASPMVSIDVPGKGKEEVAFKVVEPAGIAATKESEEKFPAGQQGAGMILDFTYGPTDVSFGQVSAREVAGPASDLDGYYANDGEKHFHTPASTEFFALGDDNRPTGGVKDKARQFGATPPWSKGRFVWSIPNRFVVRGEDGQGKEFTKTTQEFLMKDETGETTINKAGASVTRKP